MAKRPTSNLHAGYGVDVTDFARFARALRIAAPEIRTELILDLKVAGRIVAGDAQANAYAVSVRVAESVRVRTSNLSVSVVAGGDSPLAGLEELGARKGSRDKWRHPVFGNRENWVDQATHPYLAPAVARNIEKVAEIAAAALDSAIEKAVKL